MCDYREDYIIYSEIEEVVERVYENPPTAKRRGGGVVALA